MAQPTTQFLLDFNSNIETLVTESTEVVTIVIRYLWDTSKPISFEEAISTPYNGTLWKLAEDLANSTIDMDAATEKAILFRPISDQIRSVNGIPTVSPIICHSNEGNNTEPKENEKLFDVTKKYLLRKPITIIENPVFEEIPYVEGQCWMMMMKRLEAIVPNFESNIVKRPIEGNDLFEKPIIQIVDITPVN